MPVDELFNVVCLVPHGQAQQPVGDGIKNDLDLIPHIFVEERPQGAVGQAVGEDCLRVGRPSRREEKERGSSARTLPSSYVAAQGEKIQPLAGVIAHGRSREQRQCYRGQS